MDAETVFHLLVNGGFSLGIEDDRLIVKPADRISDTLRQAIKANKPALLRLVRSRIPAVSWRWMIRHADGTWTDHTTTPWASEAAMRAAYPDALEFRAMGNSAAKTGSAA